MSFETSSNNKANGMAHVVKFTTRVGFFSPPLFSFISLRIVLGQPKFRVFLTFIFLSIVIFISLISPHLFWILFLIDFFLFHPLSFDFILFLYKKMFFILLIFVFLFFF